MLKVRVGFVKNHLKLMCSMRFSGTHVVDPPLRADLMEAEWEKAKPFQSIPGPSKIGLLLGYLPGGRFHGKSLVQFNETLRAQYGDIFVIPGTFGKRDILVTFNPKDYQKIYRTEGIYPVREGLDIITYYRQKHRPDVFKHGGGLVPIQGEEWARFRSTVNPVMMNPKTTKFYAPKMNKVADEFITRIREIRDSKTLEVPANFEEEINNLTLDSVGLVALDTDLGMIRNRAGNSRAIKVIENTREFFELLFYLDLQPSLWKYIPTPKFKSVIKAMDTITELSQYYIEEAVQRIQKQPKQVDGNPESEAEKSILERLINIDRAVAEVMSMDIIIAGVDTTSSAFVGCLLALALNPEKQEKLRQEIVDILPHRDSAMTADKLTNLPYLRACIKEAFRLYPVSTGNFRSTGQDIVLSGYRVPQGVNCAMPEQLLHFDPKYYARPMEYIPERWLRGTDDRTEDGCPLNAKVPFVSLPFGFGPRICIGKRIVDLELEVNLAKIVRNFIVTYNHPTDNFFRTHIINVPAKPLQFRFQDIN